MSDKRIIITFGLLIKIKKSPYNFSKPRYNFSKIKDK